MLHLPFLLTSGYYYPFNLPSAFATLWTAFSGFQVDGVGHNILQFHELQDGANRVTEHPPLSELHTFFNRQLTWMELTSVKDLSIR